MTEIGEIGGIRTTLPDDLRPKIARPRRLARTRTSRLPSSPFARVLCGVDGSYGSDLAAMQAIGLSLSQRPATVEFIAIAEAVDGSDGATEKAADAGDLLAKAAALARGAGVRASTALRQGRRVSDILLAESETRDLLAIGCRGGARTGGVLLGSTATEIAYRARRPLLIARRTADHDDFPTCVLLASDGSPGSWPAARAAAAVAKARRSELRLVFVADGNPERRREVFRQLTMIERVLGGPPAVVESRGDPAERIVEAARASQASLIAIGRRGIGSSNGLGSVSERIARGGPCSVLLMPAAVPG